MILLCYFRPDHMNRVTLRFQMAIAVVDIARHLRILLLREKAGSWLCTLVAFTGFFGDHLYLFLNVAIALNLNILVLQRKTPYKKLQIYFWVGAIALALGIDLIPLVGSYFGKDYFNGCYLDKGLNESTRKMLKIFLIHITLLPGTLYCLIIPLLIFYYLRNDNSKVSLLSYRIVLYPLSCFLSLIGYLVYSLHLEITDTHDDYLFFWCRIGLRVSGALNLIVLALDPSFQESVKSFLVKPLAPVRNTDPAFNPAIQMRKMNSITDEEIETMSVSNFIRFL